MAKIKAASKIIRKATSGEMDTFIKEGAERLEKSAIEALDAGSKKNPRGAKKIQKAKQARERAINGIKEDSLIKATIEAGKPENSTVRGTTGPLSFKKGENYNTIKKDFRERAAAAKDPMDGMLANGSEVRRTSVRDRSEKAKLKPVTLSSKNTTDSKYLRKEIANSGVFPEDSTDNIVDKITSKGFQTKGGSFIPSSSEARIAYKNKPTDDFRKVATVENNGMKFKQSNEAKESKIFNQKNIKTAVGVGVSGAIVMNMFNKGGQMSNSELYGQQQKY